MPLVQAKCTNCGANLDVESTKDAAICPFCGTPYVVEKAINNYNVVNHITGNVVNVFGGNSADFVIRAGTLEKYNGAATDVVIPHSVTSIGERAFFNCKGLVSVTIPDSVISIGEDAFYECKGLTSVTIPDTVTSIGSRAFFGCIGLCSIILPDSLVSIGGEAFGECRNLATVIVSDDTINRLCPINKGRTHYIFKGRDYYYYHYVWNWWAFESKDWHASSPWYLKLEQNKCEQITQLNRQLWIEQGQCSFCGGEFAGVFSHSCIRCNKKKDY